MRRLGLILIIFIINSCGNSSAGNNIPQEVSTNSNIEDEISKVALQNLYIHSFANFNSKCSNQSIFWLYPPLKDVRVQIFNYNPLEAIESGDATVNIIQTTNSSNKRELQFDYFLKTFFTNCVDVTFANKTDIYPRFKIEIDYNNSKYYDFLTLFYSNTQNCASCHSSNSFDSAKPSVGWANLSDIQKDYKINILRLHDQKYKTKTAQLIGKYDFLAKKYQNDGSLESSSKNTIVSCTDCHHVMAIAGSGLNDITTLTNAIHKTHINLFDPYLANLQKCKTCHGGDSINPMFNGSIMHTRGKSFIREHKNIDKSQTINCTLCHGYNFEGSSLSKVKDSFSSRFKSYNSGDIVSCLDCHKNIDDWSVKGGAKGFSRGGRY